MLVSNCHLFRRLDTGSQARDNGMVSGSSKRATDLLVKVETLADRRPGKPVCAFFTGTPWSNTLAETWVWQRYLQPDELDAIGLLPFDAWVSAFIRYENNIEVAPDGSGFRLYRRPVGVVNAPELKMLLGQVADIMDPAQLGLARPDFDVHNVTVEATPGQREFVRDLADRADAIRNGSGRGAGDGGRADDNMLLVCNDGRKVALDPQLAGVDEQSAKIAKAAELIADAYHLGADRTFGSHATPGRSSSRSWTSAPRTRATRRRTAVCAASSLTVASPPARSGSCMRRRPTRLARHCSRPAVTVTWRC